MDWIEKRPMVVVAVLLVAGVVAFLAWPGAMMDASKGTLLGSLVGAFAAVTFAAELAATVERREVRQATLYCSAICETAADGLKAVRDEFATFDADNRIREADFKRLDKARMAMVRRASWAQARIKRITSVLFKLPPETIRQVTAIEEALTRAAHEVSDAIANDPRESYVEGTTFDQLSDAAVAADELVCEFDRLATWFAAKAHGRVH